MSKTHANFINDVQIAVKHAYLGDIEQSLYFQKLSCLRFYPFVFSGNDLSRYVQHLDSTLWTNLVIFVQKTTGFE